MCLKINNSDLNYVVYLDAILTSELSEQFSLRRLIFNYAPRVTRYLRVVSEQCNLKNNNDTKH